MSPEALAALLGGTALFGALPPGIREALARGATVRELQNGDRLIEQGARGDRLYVVVDGRLEARLERPGAPPRVLGHAGRGEVVGEMAVLSGAPRVCSIVAIREARVAEFARANVLDVVARHPDALFRLTSEIIRRAHGPAPRGAQVSPVSTIAAIPVTRTVDIARFSAALVEALGTFGEARLVRAEDLVSGPSGDTVAQQLVSVERAHDLVVYQGHAWDSSWTRRVVRQADLILLVADAAADPALSEFERDALFGERPVSAARVDLALVHPDRATAPAGTARWLRPRRVRLHHHVAMDAPADFARLARLLAGRAVQLVLGGGGARGFSHIGIVRALREAGIPIDLVGGTSMGAAIAAFVATEASAEEMQAAIGPFADRVKDVTLPLLSLFAGRGGTRALREMYGEERRIEDLWINYFAVAADLGRAEEFVHRAGPLWLAVRASSAIPGVYPPVRVQDRFLVDGAALDNLPIDVMADLSPGRVVAVDVSQERAFAFENPPASGADGSAPDDEFALRYPAAVSGWRLLLRRLNPFARAPREPHILDVLVRASEIASIRMARAIGAGTAVTLAIRPPVERFAALDFPAIDAIVEAGYRYGCEHAEAWKKQLLGPDVPQPD